MNNISNDLSALRLVIHQPNFIPRLKVLQKIVAGDLWVILDDVQFVVREWQNRARIRYLRKPENGFWVTVPVHKPNGQKSLINAILIQNPLKTKEQIFKSILHAYRASKHWDWIEEYTSITFGDMSNNLAEICTKSTLSCFSLLGLTKPTTLSSTLKSTGHKTDKLIRICKSLNAQVYLSGSGGLTYLKEDDFKAANIKVEFQAWSMPILQETDTNIDWRNISFLDLIARYGPDVLKEHLLAWKCGATIR